MRKFLLSMAAFVVALAANAQGINAKKFNGKLEKANPVQVAPQLQNHAPFKAQLAANERIAGNYTSDTYASSAEGLGLTSVPGELSIYTYWDASVFAKMNGMKLKAIRFALANAVKVSQVAIYGVASNGTATILASDTVTGSTSPAGWTTVELSSPWTINTSDYTGFYVGFTYTQGSNQYSNSSFPLSYVNEGTIQDSYVYGNYGSYGVGFYYIGTTSYGNLSVQGVVEGDFPANDMKVLYLAPGLDFYQQGGEGQYAVVVQNYGSAKAKYELAVSLDGAAIDTLTNGDAESEADSLDVMANDTIIVDFDIDEAIATGNHDLKVNVVSINGEAPTAETTDDDTLSTSFIVYKDKTDRQKNLVEHYTSSSCTYCYLGEELLEAVNNQTDKMAWVSIHGIQSSSYPDPTNTAQCDTLMAYGNLEYFPSASFDRVILDGDSYIMSIGYNEQYISQLAPVFAQLMDQIAGTYPSFVTLGINNSFDNARNLTVNVTGTGVADAQKIIGDYRLYVYLCEDSVKFNQYTNGSWVRNDNHNHVFRVALGTVMGNAINWNGDSFDATYTYDIPETWNTKNMKVVAFVAPRLDVDDLSRAAVNQCAEASLANVTGIESVRDNANAAANNSVSAIYNAAGQRVAKAQRGLNIVKYADGRTEKVVVK